MVDIDEVLGAEQLGAVDFNEISARTA